MEPVWRANSGISGRRTGTDRRRFADPGYKGPEKRIVPDRRGSGDQRRHKRYRVGDLTFVKLSSGSEENVGQLLDISKGGLSFCYFVNIDKSENYAELDIFMSGDSFRVNRIPFKTASDILLPNRSPFSPAIVKRSGIQFEALTPEQKSGLDCFLLTYTKGEA